MVNDFRIAVDVVVFCIDSNKLKVCLIKRKYEPFRGFWALPGGLVNINEGLEDAARRELKEETGIKDIYLEQLYTFGDLGRDLRGRVISVSYLSLVNLNDLILSSGDDTTEAKFFLVNEIKGLAFDHNKIIECALRRIKEKANRFEILKGLLNKEFTLTELQNVYEVVGDKSLDKRNFRKKVLKLGILNDLGKIVKGKNRPARLYSFRM